MKKIAPLSFFTGAGCVLRIGLALCAALVSLSAVDLQPGPYELGPDSHPQPGVPQGREEKLDLPTSHIFPGSDHEAWLYIPAQYDAAKPACLMIFQDGGGYVRRDGQWRVPVVFDNLIHKQEMPVTIGLFINPGVLPAAHENALPRYNRSFEYDGLGDRYARFLIEEVIPEVKKKYAVSDDANDRAIGGASSGAVCAFTAAWERPDAFRRVFSTIGTYVGLRGANDYPTLVRKTEPKPLRIFLQDGSNDLNIYGGDWWMANQEMERALVFSGYDVNHVWGDGGHDGNQGSAILPDALRWLWRDWPQPLTANPEGKSKQPLGEWCELGRGWERMTDDPFDVMGSLAANRDGEVFFLQTVRKHRGFHKIGLDGHITLVGSTVVERTLPWTITADDKLMVLAIDDIKTPGPTGWESVRFGFFDYGNGAPTYLPLATSSGGLYFLSRSQAFISLNNSAPDFLDFPAQTYWQLWFLRPDTSGPEKAFPVSYTTDYRITALTLSPDQSLLYAASDGPVIHSYQIHPEGKLVNGQPYFHLHEPDGASAGTRALAVDREGRLYAATTLGVQICDQAGRVNAILPGPGGMTLQGISFGGPVQGLTFGGPDMKFLYVSVDGAIYRRPMKVAGLRSVDAPVKPKPPRL